MIKLTAKHVERWWPDGLAVAGLVVYFICFREAPPPKHASDVFLTIVTIAAIAVGFLGTAQSITLSLGDRWMVKQLREANRLPDLADYMSIAIRSCFLASLVGGLGLLFDPDPREGIYCAYYGTLVTIVLHAAASSYRVIHLFGAIVRAAEHAEP